MEITLETMEIPVPIQHLHRQHHGKQKPHPLQQQRPPVRHLAPLLSKLWPRPSLQRELHLQHILSTPQRTSHFQEFELVHRPKPLPLCLRNRQRTAAAVTRQLRYPPIKVRVTGRKTNTRTTLPCTWCWVWLGWSGTTTPGTFYPVKGTR